jgi:hypothetical protein
VSEILIRLLLGGVVVRLFAIFSDALRPKSLAGLFGEPSPSPLPP